MTNNTGSRSFLQSLKPYLQKGPLAALALGISSGAPFAMIGATLTTRLAEASLSKKSITTFSLIFLAYNFKPLWAWMVEGINLPLLGRLGQRVSWMIFAGLLVMASIIYLGTIDPSADLLATAYAAIFVGIAGATFDIVIDAYRIETLQPHELGIGSGMSQYGWRIGAAAAGGLALIVASRQGWTAAYMWCAAFALPAMITAFILKEPPRHHVRRERGTMKDTINAIVRPFTEFFERRGAWLVLLFILLHKVGDTIANLSLRILFNDLGFSKDEVAAYDVGLGFWALMIGIFVGGIMYARWGMKRSVLVSLILMAISNVSFAWLAWMGHDNFAMSAAVGFENFSSGIGGVCVVAYLSALCNLNFTAAQYALVSAAASIVGRFVTGTQAGAMIEGLGYINFYLLTTVIAFPGIILFWMMMRAGLIDQSIGSAGVESAER